MCLQIDWLQTSVRNDLSLLPGNDTWPTCLRILVDRNVYNIDGSPPPFLSQFTNGINTAAALTDGLNFFVVLLAARFILSMHLLRFSGLQKNSMVSKPDESQNVRFTFSKKIGRDINILLCFVLFDMLSKLFRTKNKKKSTKAFQFNIWFANSLTGIWNNKRQFVKIKCKNSFC